MAGDIESDEAGLRRAIAANPADDAPWLVYADWLQEHGHEAEAAALRRHLPDAQAAMYFGSDLPAALAFVAHQAEAAAAPALPAYPKALPPAPPPGPGAWATPGRPAGWRPGPILFAVLGSLLLGLYRAGFEAARERDPPDRTSEDRLIKEALAKAGQFPGAKAAKEPPPAPRVRPPAADGLTMILLGAEPWDREELVGYTLRREDDWSVLAFHFAADGTVHARLGLKPEAVTRGEGRWWIDIRGVLTISLSDGRSLELAKRKADADRYEVTRGGRSEVFVRDRSAP